MCRAPGPRRSGRLHEVSGAGEPFVSGNSREAGPPGPFSRGARRGLPGASRAGAARYAPRMLRAVLAALLLALPPGAGAAFELESPAFGDGEPIPRRFTCQGAEVSPPLVWKDPPEGTRSFALVVDDPDAPDPANPQRTWVHWVLYDLPADARSLAEGASPDGLPEGTRPGKSDWKRTGWGGPCPPIGRHRYFHKLYALDTKLGDLGEPTKDELLRALEGHVLGRRELVGTYAKD